MAFPVVPLALGAKALQGLFGGGKENVLPQEVLDALKAWANQDFQNMFVPDEAAFTGSTKANIANIMAKLPVNMDAFSGQLASRGLFGSGEGVTHLYSDVFAPIQREANTAAASGLLDYTRSAQQGKIAGAGLQADALKMLMSGYSAQQPTGAASFFNNLGGLADPILGSAASKELDMAELQKLLPILQTLFGGQSGGIL